LTTTALLFVAGAQGQDDKKADRKEKVTPAGQIAGKVAALDGAQKTLTLEVRLGRSTKNVTYQTTDEVKIRLRNPRPAYDDKGKIRNPTAKEKKEQKGKDSKLPGYEAGWDDLKTNEIVTISFGTKKGEKNPVATLIMIERMPN
jgi:hypothetical protein